MSERYTVENMKVNRPLVLIKDSKDPLPMTPWDVAKRLNNLERQLEKREDDYRKLRERSDEQLAEKDRQLEEARGLAKYFSTFAPANVRDKFKQQLKEKGE